MPGLNIGIDLGTSTITAFCEGKGIVVAEATAISYDSFSGDIIAIGNSAMEMTGKAPESVTLTKVLYGFPDNWQEQRKLPGIA